MVAAQKEVSQQSQWHKSLHWFWGNQGRVRCWRLQPWVHILNSLPLRRHKDVRREAHKRKGNQACLTSDSVLSTSTGLHGKPILLVTLGSSSPQVNFFMYVGQWTCTHSRSTFNQCTFLQILKPSGLTKCRVRSQNLAHRSASTRFAHKLFHRLTRITSCSSGGVFGMWTCQGISAGTLTISPKQHSDWV